MVDGVGSEGCFLLWFSDLALALLLQDGWEEEEIKGKKGKGKRRQGERRRGGALSTDWRWWWCCIAEQKQPSEKLFNVALGCPSNEAARPPAQPSLTRKINREEAQWGPPLGVRNAPESSRFCWAARARRGRPGGGRPGGRRAAAGRG